MVNKKRITRSQCRKQVLILIGRLLVAMIALIATPAYLTTSQPVQYNELELRARVSEAADDYMKGETVLERQAAARRIKSLREGGRSYNPESGEQMISFLRTLLFITIVVLLWKIIVLVYLQMKPNQVHQT